MSETKEDHRLVAARNLHQIIQDELTSAIKLVNNPKTKKKELKELKLHPQGYYSILITLNQEITWNPDDFREEGFTRPLTKISVSWGWLRAAILSDIEELSRLARERDYLLQRDLTLERCLLLKVHYDSGKELLDTEEQYKRYREAAKEKRLKGVDRHNFKYNVRDPLVVGGYLLELRKHKRGWKEIEQLNFGGGSRKRPREGYTLTKKGQEVCERLFNPEQYYSGKGLFVDGGG